MATSVFFNGAVISVPGSYSKVDASGLETVGLGATGIVAMLGTSVGGRPVSNITDPADLLRLTTPQQNRDAFRSGDLLEAGGILFEPSNDEQILAGAQQIVACKVNPATQGTATLANAAGSAVDLTSQDWGAFVDQINITVATGTNQGKLITIIFEDVTEAFDDVGGDNIFTLDYETGTDTWDTMTAEINAGGRLKCLATRAELGLDADVTSLLAQGAARVVSSDAGDIGQTITLYGLNATGVAVSETLTLNGTTPVNGSQIFGLGDLLGAVVSGTTAGAVTVSDQVIPTTVMTVALGTNPSKGLVVGSAMFVANKVVQGVLDAAGTENPILVGKNAAGVTQLHALTLEGTDPVLGASASITAVFTWDGTTTVVATGADTSEVVVNDWIRLDSDGQWFQITALVTNTSVTISNPDGLTIPSGATARSVTKSVPTWSELTTIVLGDVAAARTFTASATAAETSATVQTTVQQAADFYNAKQVGVLGFFFSIVTSSLSFLMANMDTATATSVVGAPSGFLADLYAFINEITTKSALLSAAEASGATGGAPNNTTTPVFLSGGGEGTTTFANYQAALNLLKRLRINTIVPLTGDPAVHAAVEAHCAYMGGVGRSERDGKLGALNAALTDVPTKTEFKAQAVDLNSRHTQLVGQAIERFNTSGIRTEFLPPFAACVAAGMQAGSPVGTPLTHKVTDVLAFRQDTTWNPLDDAEELIQAGVLFLENVDGIGRRWVRGVTTHLTSDNLAFTEASVNQAANFAAFNFRNAMESFVGQQGFSGTVNGAKGIAITQLGLQVDAQVLVGYQALAIDIVLDVLEVSVQIAPVVPINFVTTVLHLVTAQQLTA